MEDSTATIIISLIVGSIIWIYAMVRTIKSEFYKPKLKKIWLIALILCPFSALFFPFIGDKQTK